MSEEQRMIMQEKDYNTGWKDGYNKCLEDYQITQLAMLQLPHYTFPIDEGNKVLAYQLSHLDEQNTHLKKIIRELLNTSSQPFKYLSVVAQAQELLKE